MSTGKLAPKLTEADVENLANWHHRVAAWWAYRRLDSGNVAVPAKPAVRDRPHDDDEWDVLGMLQMAIMVEV